MKFWIVTPSYNQLAWLRLCVRSVADQAGNEVEVHHHVQDACSLDGTVEWLEGYAEEIVGAMSSSRDAIKSEGNVASTKGSSYSFSFSSEKDEGMYDAINRGWKRATDDVDVIAHLNCDEQYLPEALKKVATFFEAHQKADVVLADMIVIDAAGDYICHRRSLKPYAFTTRYCVGGFTATTFQRASITKQKQVFFDTSWKNFGDKVWYNALHKAGCRFAVCNELVSVFADTGANLNWTEEGQRERKLYEERFLNGRRFGTTVIARTLGLRRALKELILKAPENYLLYLSKNEQKRTVKPINNPTGLWHKKWKKT